MALSTIGCSLTFSVSVSRGSDFRLIFDLSIQQQSVVLGKSSTQLATCKSGDRLLIYVEMHQPV